MGVLKHNHMNKGVSSTTDCLKCMQLPTRGHLWKCISPPSEVIKTLLLLLLQHWAPDLDLDLSGSHDVISHMTIRLAMVNFLWVVHCDHASIWHH